MIHLQQALHDLSTLPSLTTLKLDPAVHGTNLNAQHLLVTILWLKITHALCLLDPRVPDDGVGQIVTDDVESWLSAFENGSCGL